MQDWNDHIGRMYAGYEGIYGGFGYGDRNAEGDRVLDFAVANTLVIGNTFFAKRESHLVTYQSGTAKSQIDYIMLRKRAPKLAKNIKIIPSEECVPQHKLLVCDQLLKPPPFYRKKFSPKLRTWKLRQPNEKAKFEQAFIDKLSDNHPEEGETSTEEIWNRLKSALLDAADNVCSKTKKHHKRETWWWNEEVNSAVAEKRRCWKAWKQGENKELYLQAK